MQYAGFQQRFVQSCKGFLFNLPMLFAVVLLAGLFESFISPDMLLTVFSGQPFLDTLVATLSGGVSVGQPFVSYLIGKQLLDSGVSYYALSAFLLSWVTLGLLQLPYEYHVFGARFTVRRNLLALISVPLVSFACVQTLRLCS